MNKVPSTMKAIVTTGKAGVHGLCKALEASYAVISIQDSGDTKPRLPRHAHRLGSLFLEFDDICPDEYVTQLDEHPSTVPCPYTLLSDSLRLGRTIPSHPKLRELLPKSAT